MRCHRNATFQALIGGRRFNLTLHNFVTYLAPGRNESTMLYRAGGDLGNKGKWDFGAPYIRRENQTDWDRYAQLVPPRSCSTYDPDFNGSFDVFCVDKVSENTLAEKRGGVSTNQDDLLGKKNFTTPGMNASMLHVDLHCVDQMFMLYHNWLPQESGVHYNASFRFEAWPVLKEPKNPLSPLRNESAWLFEDLSPFGQLSSKGTSDWLYGQCREECIKKGPFWCGSFVVKR